MGGSRTGGATQLGLVPFPQEQPQLCCRQEQRGLHTSDGHPWQKPGTPGSAAQDWPGMEGTGWDFGAGQALQAHLALSKASPFTTTTARTFLQPAVSKNN